MPHSDLRIVILYYFPTFLLITNSHKWPQAQCTRVSTAISSNTNSKFCIIWHFAIAVADILDACHSNWASEISRIFRSFRLQTTSEVRVAAIVSGFVEADSVCGCVCCAFAAKSSVVAGVAEAVEVAGRVAGLACTDAVDTIETWGTGVAAATAVEPVGLRIVTGAIAVYGAKTTASWRW